MACAVAWDAYFAVFFKNFDVNTVFCEVKGCERAAWAASDNNDVVADRVSERFQARIFDNEGSVFTKKQKGEWRELLNRALASFDQVGISPGSPEALRLFSD